MHFKNSTSRPFGFSLIEILIALGILAGSVGILMSQVVLSTRLSVEDEALVRAVTLANDKMIEVQATLRDEIKKGNFPEEEEEAGEFEAPFADYSWTYQIKKIEIPAVNVDSEESGGQNALVVRAVKNITKEISKSVRELTLTVFWGEQINEKGETVPKELSLTTHIVNLK